MARNVAFINREGMPIAQETWREKSNDPSYWTVRQYDNGVVNITLKWVGRIQNPGDMYPEFWPVYILLVKNYGADGTLSVDPVDSDRTFPSEAAAVEAYDQFLLRWTESKLGEDGVLVEAGNTLELPVGPDPNKPTSTPPELPEGVW